MSAPSSVPGVEQQLLTVDDIAARANIPTRMAQRLLDERRLPIVKVGRYVRVRASDLEAYFERGTRSAAR
ncbi:MAG: DNA-binding protein [Leifsonia xyli]|nr:MAG: DNA-binding protein [Leifsonia xyli]